MTTALSLKTKVSRARKRKFVYEYLLTHPCVDCGEADPVVLEFDHITGEKSFGFGQLTCTNVSWERIALEIDKCAVRCSNCHKRRHAAEMNWYDFSILDEFPLRSPKDYHGTKNGYTYHKCRCEKCTLAQSEYQKRWRKSHQQSRGSIA